MNTTINYTKPLYLSEQMYMYMAKEPFLSTEVRSIYLMYMY